MEEERTGGREGGRESKAGESVSFFSLHIVSVQPNMVCFFFLGVTGAFHTVSKELRRVISDKKIGLGEKTNDPFLWLYGFSLE